MESDRKLLELAAKAAGIKDYSWGDHPNIVNWDGEYPITNNWNPLEDDGDEARLEAALGLSVIWYRQFVSVNGHNQRYRKHHGDKQAARRRAGVIAAAEIGKTLG